MKIRCILIMIFTFPMILTGQVQWQDDGVPLRSAENLRWFGDTVELEDGSVVALWRDTRSENYQIYAQRLDENGNALWDEEGKNLSNNQYRVYTFKAIPSSDGNFFIAWYQSEDDSDDGFITIQKINSNGEPCWSAVGVSVNIDNFQNKMSINSDDNGGVFLLWEEYHDLKGVRLESDGLVAAGWDTAGSVLLSYSSSNDLKSIDCLNLNGNLIFTYSIENGNDFDVYMQKIEPDASFVWGTSGILIATGEIYNTYLSILASSNGFWIGWCEPTSDFDINIYRFNEDGTLYWSQPTTLNLTNAIVCKLSFISDANDNIYAGWYDDIDLNYHIAKIDDNQNILWGDEGITAFSFNNEYPKYYAIQTTPDNEVNFICTYDEEYYDQYLYFDRFDASGASVISEPLELNHIEGRINFPALNVSNNSIITWQENDNDDVKIKFQIVNNQNQPILTPSGETMFSGKSGSCFNPKTISMNNKTAVFWTVFHNVYFQTIDNNENKLSENGIQINSENSISYGEYFIGYDEINERVLNSWTYGDEEFNNIVVQATDEDGNLLWGDNGVSVTNSELWLEYSQLSTLNGDTYVGWTEYNGDWLNPEFYLYANKIDDSGNLCWGESGINLFESIGNMEYVQVLGRMYVWSERTYPEYSIYAMLLDENGNPEPGWEEEGKLIANGEGTYFRVAGCDVPGGHIIVWRTLQGDDTNIYGQFITENGDVLWGDDGIQLAEVFNPTTSDELNIFYEDALYIDWYDYNISINQTEIYLQKFDLEGNPFWPDNGIVTAADINTHNFLPINDYILVIYDYHFDNDFDVGAKLFSADGEELWETILCDKPHDQRRPILSKCGENNIVISWLDNRDGIYSYSDISAEYTEVYAQNIYVDPTYTPNDILNAITGQLHQNYPNPFNPSTTIEFSLNTDPADNIELVIYNLKGQKVKTFLINSSTDQPINSVIWNGDDDSGKPVSSGIYFYKLKSDNFEKTKKMLLMK
jgi:hypothetical protein